MDVQEVSVLTSDMFAFKTFGNKYLNVGHQTKKDVALKYKNDNILYTCNTVHFSVNVLHVLKTITQK